MNYIGRPMPRVEDLRLVAGRGRYTDDVQVDGEVCCVFVRSPHAHARIERIDASAARDAEGVLAVLTGADYEADRLAALDHAADPLDALDVGKRALGSAPGAKVIE